MVSFNFNDLPIKENETNKNIYNGLAKKFLPNSHIFSNKKKKEKKKKKKKKKKP